MWPSSDDGSHNLITNVGSHVHWPRRVPMCVLNPNLAIYLVELAHVYAGSLSMTESPFRRIGMTDCG